MPKFLLDFKEFAMKGNVIDLAVWVIIGGAFGKIVTSLVADIATPAIGILLGGIDLTKYSYTVHSPVSGNDVSIRYGQFLQNTFDFLIIAISVFVFVSLMKKAFKKKEREEAKKDVPKPEDIVLLEEIRDLLANKKSETAKPMPANEKPAKKIASKPKKKAA